MGPLLGIFVGGLFGRLIPARWFTAVAAILLILLGLMLLREAREDESDEILQKAPLAAAVAVGADEFGFGLTLPYLHAYALLPALIVAVQAPIAVSIGLALGGRLRGIGWLRWVPAAGVLCLGVLAALAAAGVPVPVG